MMIKAGFALLAIDEDFSVKEKVCIEVDGGVITNISSWASCTDANQVVGGEWLMVLPQPANAHVHSGDFAFPEFGVELFLEDAVAPPNGLKHRLLSKLEFSELVEAIRKVYTSAWEKGVGLLVDFREGGGAGCKAAREALAKIDGMKVLILGRPGPEWPSSCDGLGISSPLDYDLATLKTLAQKSRLTATHIAETPRARELGDLERAIDAGFKVIVHGVHLTLNDLELLKEYEIGLVLCLRSNMWHGLGLPKIREAYKIGVKIGLGTDNAAWFTPDPWEEAKLLIYIGRLLGMKREASRMAASALFETGYAMFGEKPSTVREGSTAKLILAQVPEGVSVSMDKLYAILKRIESKHIIARLDKGKITPLIDKSSMPYQVLRQLTSSNS